jgi:hypothetical protein
LPRTVELIERPGNINDPAFASEAAERLIELMDSSLVARGVHGHALFAH